MAEKALTKEDLIYILQGIFRISDALDNSLEKTNKGWYVKSYEADLRQIREEIEDSLDSMSDDHQSLSDDFKTHTNDNVIHVSKSVRDVIDRLSVNENGEILFDKRPFSMIDQMVSKKDNNAIQQLQDGLFVNHIDTTPYDNHLKDTILHVTATDKDTWDNIFNRAMTYCDEIVSGLTLYAIYFVTVLPSTGIDEHALYMLADDPFCVEECTYTVYVYRDGQWQCVSLTKKTLVDYVLYTDLEKILEPFKHQNREILDKLSTSKNNELLYDGKPIAEFTIDPDGTNAIEFRPNGLYAKDFSEEIKSLQVSSALSKVNLYNEEISQSGKYKLKDTIDNYNLLLVEYYYKPDNPDRGTPGCIQTAVIDPDTLNDAYNMGMLYILQYGYGVMTSNSQIHIVGDELTVDYYHNVCIYKITGIRKGEEEDAE